MFVTQWVDYQYWKVMVEKMDQEMNIKERTRNEGPQFTISFGGLILYVFQHWKLLFFMGMLGAFCLGGYKYYKKIQMDSIRVKEEYFKQEKIYEGKKASDENVINQLTRKQEEIKQYLKESVLANLDPYNEMMATVDVSIGYTGESSRKNETAGTQLNWLIEREKLVTEFCSFINHKTDYSAWKIKDKYIRELVTVVPDYRIGNIRVLIRHNSEKNAKSIAEAISSQLARYIDENGEKIEHFQISIGEPTVRTVVDNSIPICGKNGVNEIYSSCISDIEAYQSAIDSLKVEMDQLEKPSIESSPSFVKMVIYFLAGSVTGVLIGVFLCILRVAILGILVDERDISHNLGIENLFTISGKMTDDDWRIAELILNNMIGEVNQVYIVFNVNDRHEHSSEFEGVLHQLQKKIPNSKIVSLGILNNNAESISLLKKSQKIIMISVIGITRYRDSLINMKILNMWDCNVVGNICMR